MWCSLIGFMGAGKSTVAVTLAERAVIPAVDLDDEIERRAGASITDLFATRGEDGFRLIETEALADLDGGREIVLACGGGVVERAANVERLRRQGLVIWLDLSWEQVLTRLGDADDDERPLLASLAPRELAALYRRRQPLYAHAAHFRLQVDKAGPEILARQVLACRLAWLRQNRERRR